MRPCPAARSAWVGTHVPRSELGRGFRLQSVAQLKVEIGIIVLRGSRVVFGDCKDRLGRFQFDDK